MTPCPESPAGRPCVFAPHKMGTPQRIAVVCMLCGAPKPEPKPEPEPCYFAEAGEAARRLGEGGK